MVLCFVYGDLVLGTLHQWPRYTWSSSFESIILCSQSPTILFVVIKLSFFPWAHASRELAHGVGEFMKFLPFDAF